MKFIQFHTLSSYAGVLLNRDDRGFAKRLPFGGVTRTRVSSQCIKHHWREFSGKSGFTTLEIPEPIRSRRIFEEKIGDPLKKEHPALVVDYVVGVLMKIVSAPKTLKQIFEGDIFKVGTNPLRTEQILVLGRNEIEFLRKSANLILIEMKDSDLYKQEGNLLQTKKPEKEEEKAKKAREDKNKKKITKHKAEMKTIFEAEFNTKDEETKQTKLKNLKQLGQNAGLSASLFGRMVTSDKLSAIDAPIHVAHAITVHAEHSESDYFTAVDQLISESDSGETGSAYLAPSDLSSGLFYHYTVIDVDGLIENLAGYRENEDGRKLAAEVVKLLIKVATTVSPGAKKGSTAPYAFADCVLVECGDEQPRTLANAFLKPVSADSEYSDLLENTYQALASYIKDTDDMYGKNDERAIAARQADGLRDALQLEKKTVEQVADWVAQKINGAIA